MDQSMRPKGIETYIPILGWLPRYPRKWIRIDVLAGLVAGRHERIAFPGRRLPGDCERVGDWRDPELDRRCAASSQSSTNLGIFVCTYLTICLLWVLRRSIYGNRISFIL